MMSKSIPLISAVMLAVLIGLPCWSTAEGDVSPTYAEVIEQHVLNGQYALAKDVARKWAAEPDADLELMAESCTLLSNKKLHESAVILLERLDWIMPEKCSWPNDTLYYMRQQGMDSEMDQVLTYGTALTAREDTRPPRPALWIDGYQTEVAPRAAGRLFNFYRRDEEALGPLFERYARELEVRPGDIGLITEYAYWLAREGQIKRAVEIIERIDYSTLDLLTLFDLGTLWQNKADVRLVKYSIGPLKHASTLELNLAEVSRYTKGWQSLFNPPSLINRLFRERVLLTLGRSYVHLEQYTDAKKIYEQYLALPRRERWGDRTRIQKEYAGVLAELGRTDDCRIDLENRAEKSGEGKDWAELAAYLQGQGDIEAAITAWEKAINETEPTPRGHKVERPREDYRRQLIRMLNDNRMYEEEIRVRKDALAEGLPDYGRIEMLREIAKAHVQLGQKDEAIAYLMAKLDEQFDIRIVYLIIRVDYEKNLFDNYSISHHEAETLPAWTTMLKKMWALDEPARSAALARFYAHYAMYAEYVDLVEQMPAGQLDWSRMSRLMDSAHRCGRPERTVYWGRQLLEHVDEAGFPVKGSREYINILEDISDYAARAGDFDTSLEYAKKLCLFVPKRFYFAGSLAKLAVAQNRRDELTGELEQFAGAHPDRWVVWQVLADVYKVFGDEAGTTASLQQVERLK